MHACVSLNLIVREIYIKPNDLLSYLIDQSFLPRNYGISRFDVTTENYFRSKRRVRRYLLWHRSRYVLLKRVKSHPIIFPVTPFVHAFRVPLRSRFISHSRRIIVRANILPRCLPHLPSM